MYLQDCVELTLGKGYYSVCRGEAKAVNSLERAFYVRGGSDEWLESGTADHWGEGVVTKPVSVDEMHRWLKNHPNVFMAAIA